MEDGGGNGSTFSSVEAGEDDFFGGEYERKFIGFGMSLAGGVTLTVGVGGWKL